MLTVMLHWTEPTGHLHSAPPGEGADALMARFGRLPDQVSLADSLPGIRGRSQVYAPPTDALSHAARVLPAAVAALEEAETSLAGHATFGPGPGRPATERVLAVVRAAVATCRKRGG